MNKETAEEIKKLREDFKKLKEDFKEDFNKLIFCYDFKKLSNDLKTKIKISLHKNKSLTSSDVKKVLGDIGNKQAVIHMKEIANQDDIYYFKGCGKDESRIELLNKDSNFSKVLKYADNMKPKSNEPINKVSTDLKIPEEELIPLLHKLHRFSDRYSLWEKSLVKKY